MIQDIAIARWGLSSSTQKHFKREKKDHIFQMGLNIRILATFL